MVKLEMDCEDDETESSTCVSPERFDAGQIAVKEEVDDASPGKQKTINNRNKLMQCAVPM